ncbi:hypothetical protein B0T16DRAFT_495485 [Cercophora newfieldiana]|uniref:C2H2-type domain-containing protein n=1 Tax=Cercophora newfieldiana TaxID=92897 RepID=A0AA40CJE5_9PEZI|nr:hypothetical protein B0T16DRAFT_495485 [Cercophora newfieldiana]
MKTRDSPTGVHDVGHDLEEHHDQRVQGVVEQHSERFQQELGDREVPDTFSAGFPRIQKPFSSDMVDRAPGASVITTVPRPPEAFTLDEEMLSPEDYPSGCDSVPSPESQDDAMTGLSDADEPSPASTDSDDALASRAVRVLIPLLDHEFDVRLGISQPPEDMVDALSVCLNQIALSLERHRRQGDLIPINTAPLSSDTTAAFGLSIAANDVGTPGAPRRRPRGEDEDDVPDDDPDEDGGGAKVGPGDRINRKKAKVEQSYPCPFRKRNPLRFNFRDFEICARAPLKSMTELKKHLRKYHLQREVAYECPRCHEKFPRPEDRDEHVRKDRADMCDIRRRGTSPDPIAEETISAALGEQLCNRAQHFTWSSLWQVMFPQDKLEDIPPPEFEFPVELHEVVEAYRSGLPDLQASVSTTLAASPLAASIQNTFKHRRSKNPLVDGWFADTLLFDKPATFFHGEHNHELCSSFHSSVAPWPINTRKQRDIITCAVSPTLFVHKPGSSPGSLSFHPWIVRR